MKTLTRYFLSTLLSLSVLVLPWAALAQTDLGINAGGLWLSVPFPNIEINKTVRLYAKVQNTSAVDTNAQVEFYVDDALLGSRPVSVVAQDSATAFWDWETGATERKVALSVRIASQQVQDTNANNDEITLYDIWINADKDGDGAYNQKDNCPDISNADQKDTNKDGVGDACTPAPKPVAPAPTNPAPTAAPVAAPTAAPKPTPAPEVKKAETSVPSAPVAPATPTPAPAVAETAAEPSAVTADSSLEVKTEETVADVSVPEPELLSYANELTIQKEQLGWNVFRLRASLPLGMVGSGYNWDFGDGESASVAAVEHTFRKPGTYGVQLSVTNPEGETLSTTQQIHVGFFHLANWRLWIIIVLLAVIIIVAALLAGMADNAVPETEPRRRVQTPASPDEQSLNALTDAHGGLDTLAATGTPVEALPDELALLESIKPNQSRVSEPPTEPTLAEKPMPAIEPLAPSKAPEMPAEPELVEEAAKPKKSKKTAPKKAAAKKRKPSKAKRVV